MKILVVFSEKRIRSKLHTKNRGFTLIELLIVITIISLVSTILVVGIKSQLDRAKDARAKSNMNQLRIEAAKIKNDYGTYDPNIFCCSGPSCKQEVITNCDEIKKQVEVGPVIHSLGNEFCVYIKLNKGPYFCLDSTGIAGEFNSVSCATGTYACSI